MYYVILSSLWKMEDNTERALFMLRKTRVLLRVGAIKYAICSLPLVPNAQRANLTLTSNPLTQKRPNAHRVYSTSDKQIHFSCAYVEWHSIDEGPIFLPNLFWLPVSVPVSPFLHPNRWPPSNRALTPDVQFQCRLRDQLGWVCQWLC